MSIKESGFSHFSSRFSALSNASFSKSSGSFENRSSISSKSLRILSFILLTNSFARFGFKPDCSNAFCLSSFQSSNWLFERQIVSSRGKNSSSGLTCSLSPCLCSGVNLLPKLVKNCLTFSSVSNELANSGTAYGIVLAMFRKYVESCSSSGSVIALIISFFVEETEIALASLLYGSGSGNSADVVASLAFSNWEFNKVFALFERLNAFSVLPSIPVPEFSYSGSTDEAAFNRSVPDGRTPAASIRR